MRRMLLTSLVAAGLLAVVGRASAQPPGIYRPAISPYLNLSRGGNAGINYYGLVRPQIQTNQSLLNLQSQINTVENQQQNQGQAGEGDTGVVGGFQTQWAYFQNVPLGPAGLKLAGYGQGGGVGGIGTNINRGFGSPVGGTGIGIIAGSGGTGFFFKPESRGGGGGRGRR